MPDHIVQRSKIAEAAALVAVAVALLGSYTSYNLSKRQTREGKQAHDALCASKQNTQEQIASSVQFLNDLKSGKRQPIPGITEADILAGLARQQKYLDSLKPLHC